MKNMLPSSIYILLLKTVTVLKIVTDSKIVGQGVGQGVG